VLENQEQLKDGKESGLDQVINDSSNIANLSSALPNYIYSIEGIDKFFASDHGQEEEHTLEESICRSLICKHIHKPFFYYCKLDPNVENVNLKSIEDHIRLKNPERYKAKLLEILDKEKVI
jgi:hypothetical protein